jgi:glucokinase
VLIYPNQMNSTPCTILGIDVGGTKTSLGVVSFPAGQVLFERSFATRPERGGEALLGEIAAAATTLTAQARQAGHPLSSVGIGICELVEPSGRIASHNCISWTENQVRTQLSHFGPVTLEADVRAAAVAEALFGTGKPFGIFIYITVGTGIACCLMLEGRPYLGARGATGTMASSPLSLPCEQCGQVNRRTLEEIASGPALVARLNQIKPNAAATGTEVLAAAANGDAGALAVIQSASEALESTVALLVNVLDPEAVIVGGGLGLSEGPFWDSFTASARKHIWSDMHRELPILRASTGVRAGVIGAAAAAWNRGSRRQPADGKFPFELRPR